MSPDRWQQLIDRLDDAGSIESKETVDLGERPGSVVRVIAKTSAGKFRFSWTTEPKRIGEKALYSKRGGSTVSVQTQYDDSEQIHVFTVEKFEENTEAWQVMDPKMFV